MKNVPELGCQFPPMSNLLKVLKTSQPASAQRPGTSDTAGTVQRTVQIIPYSPGSDLRGHDGRGYHGTMMKLPRWASWVNFMGESWVIYPDISRMHLIYWNPDDDCRISLLDQEVSKGPIFSAALERFWVRWSNSQHCGTRLFCPQMPTVALETQTTEKATAALLRSSAQHDDLLPYIVSPTEAKLISTTCTHTHICTYIYIFT